MKKIDIHVHIPVEDLRMDRYLDLMDRGEVLAALVHAVPMCDRDNADVLRVVRAHPDRLFGSVHVDLREPSAKCIDLVRHYAQEGFRSIKLFPNLGFDPNDESLDPFWQAVEEAGLMCLSHCGYVDGLQNLSNRVHSLNASPFHFEVPMRRHPGVNFIFAHFGGGATYLETVVVLSRFANAYADTCPGWGRWVFAHAMPGIEDLKFHNVLYGTDNAGDQYPQQETWWTEKLTSLGKTSEDIRKYFHDNSAGLLKIL